MMSSAAPANRAADAHRSLVVALAGGAAGLLVAAWGLAAFRSIAPAQFAGLPGIAGVGIDGAS